MRKNLHVLQISRPQAAEYKRPIFGPQCALEQAHTVDEKVEPAHSFPASV
jgi:hypothetical protein